MANTGAPQPRASVQQDVPGATSWERVLLVLERLAASNDLDEVLGLIVDSIRDCLRADRATVFQYDPRTQELFSSQAHGVKGGEIRFQVTKGIAGEAARTRSIINVPDCYADARFNPEFDRKSGYRTRNMLAIPLVSSDGGLEGVAQVLNKAPEAGPVFNATDEAIARALAAQAAIAIRRARFIDSEARKKQIEADLQRARTIQQSTFPKHIPQLPGYSIAGQTIPAQETGGDTFDIIDLRSGEEVSSATGLAGDAAGGWLVSGGLLVTLGDATGHGIGPALSIAQFHAMVRMGALLDATLDRIVTNLNTQLCADLPPGRFITAFIGAVDPVRHVIRYCAAGQAPLIVMRADGAAEELAANALPLGISTDFPPEPVEPIRLGPGDSFLLLSDGYYEAHSPGDVQFGVDRLVAAARAARAGTAQAILEAIHDAVTVHADGRAFDDDQTAIIVKREGGLRTAG